MPQITNKMKAQCHGEFTLYVATECGECIDLGADKDCPVCQGEIVYDREVNVPWNTQKNIYRAMYNASPEPQRLADLEQQLLACQHELALLMNENRS